MGELGATCFGAVIGWCLYFNTRHRKSHQVSDLPAMIGAVGGAAVLALFPGVQFGYYGAGLFVGFFGYFLIGLLVAARLGEMRVFLFGGTPKGQAAGPADPFMIR
jgi:hypothetical protein